jgi:hypothetical protein
LAQQPLLLGKLWRLTSHGVTPSVAAKPAVAQPNGVDV